MTAALDLDSILRATPSCAGLALLTGEALALTAHSGEPTAAGWASWSEVVTAATALLQEPPVASSEVMLRSPQSLVLLEARPGGAVVVVMALGKTSAGMALVQARVAAAKVPGPSLSDESAVPGGAS
jgi:hypothetical protein